MASQVAQTKPWSRRNLGCICPVLKWAPLDAPPGTKSIPEKDGECSTPRRIKNWLPCGHVLMGGTNIEVRLQDAEGCIMCQSTIHIFLMLIHQTTPNLTLQTLACDKQGHKEAVSLLNTEILNEIVKLVKKAQAEGKKKNYIMGRLLYKMLMRPLSSMVRVSKVLLAEMLIASSCTTSKSTSATSCCCLH
jgi:hypothetical protein